MVTLTAIDETDMTNWDLTDPIGGTVVTSTATEWNITGAIPTRSYEFDGVGLTYDGAGGPPTPLPNGGTFTGFSQYDTGVLTLTITGNVGAKKLAGFLAANDLAGLQKFWFNGNDTFLGSTGDDYLAGFDGKDGFDFSNGGDDVGLGLKNDDTFVMGAALTAADAIDGGDGADQMTLNGDYFLVFNNTTLVDVETITLTAGHTYELTFQPANIGAGGLAVDGTDLDVGEDLLVFLNTGNKALTASGGAGDDVFHGANGSDTFDGAKGIDSFNGGGAADTLTGGNGDDSFLYLAAAASTGINHDTITDFDSNNADLIILDHLFNDVNAPLTTGTLSAASFDADMAAAITGAVMGKYDAVLFRPDAGDFDGDVFLVVDMNHKAGYQAGKDVVILMGNGSELGDLGAEDFGAVV